MKLLAGLVLVTATVLVAVSLFRRVMGTRSGARFGHGAAALVFSFLALGEAGALLSSWTQLGTLRRTTLVAVGVLLAAFAVQHLVRFRRAGSSTRSR